MTDLLTVQDVAKLLRLSPSTVYKYVENGKLPSVLVGTNRRFFPDQIETFLRAGIAENNRNTRTRQEHVS